MPRNKFIKGDNIFTLMIKTLYFPLPLKKGGIEFEIALISPLMITLIAMTVIFWGILQFILVQKLEWIPSYCVIPMLLLLISGFIVGKGVKSTLRSKLGLDSNFLFLRGTSYEMETKVKGRGRFISYILVSLIVGSFVTWYIYVKPLNYFQLGVKGDIEMTVSLIRTWVIFIIPKYFREWILIFVATLTFLFVADIFPFSRQVLKRTNWLNLLAVLLFVMFIYMMGDWWLTIYDPVY